MDLDFSEEQEMLREMVRGICKEHSSIEVVRAMEDDPIGYPAQLWKQLAESDLLGILLPEKFGGSEQSMLEAAILYEEFGRALAPTPHFVSCVMSGGVLVRAGSDAQKQTWLPKIISGEAILTPAWHEPKNSCGPRGVQMRAVPAGNGDGDGFILNGTKLFVQFAKAATRLIVLARTGDGETDVDLFLVDPNAAGIQLTQKLSLASDTQYRVDFSNVRVSQADRIGAAKSGWKTWDEAMHDGIILLAAQAAGGAQQALAMTVKYSLERKQFDQPLGAFQALAHNMADAATEIDGGTTLVYEAAWARAKNKPIHTLAPMAKLFMGKVYRNTTAMAQQIHGGNGFTIEYDIQLFFRRAKQLQITWWDTSYLEELVAKQVLDA